MKRIGFLSLLLISIAWGGVQVHLERPSIPLYEIAVLSAQSNDSYANPFQDASFQADFTSPSGRVFHAYGFYYDTQNWMIRFMPGETGTWRYSWQFNSSSGSGGFLCTSRENLKLHGHIRIDPANPHKLRYDDGTPLHWVGGKYLCFKRVFGFEDLQPLSVPERLSPDVYIAYAQDYLSKIAAMGLNGVVLKFSVLPLNYDLRTMDLDYFQYADQIIVHAMNLGINVQANFFDSWGKRKQGVDWASDQAPPVSDLLLEPWDPATFTTETEFYLRYLVSRYAAYSNITWELWNEAQKKGVSAEAATTQYIAKIRNFDPYDLPIGASEIYVAPYKSLDMTFCHAGWKCDYDEWNWTHAVTLDPTFYAKYRTYTGYGFANGKPILWNEIHPNDGFTPQQYADWYRACYWGNLTAGAVGTGEFVWEDIQALPDLSTTYHAYFAAFINQLRDINSLMPDDGEVQSPTGTTATLCANPGKEYVAYHFTQTDNSQSDLKIRMQPGSYYCQYYNPKTGQWMTTRESRSFSTVNFKTFTTPVFDQDIVLYIIEKNFNDHTTPVELAGFDAKCKGGGVWLEWQTLSETDNYGFQVERSQTDGEFIALQFIAGYGTSQEKHHYRCFDAPTKPETYHYRLKQIDLDGSFQYSPEVQVQFNPQPVTADLAAFPNPTHGATTFSYRLTEAGDVTIRIYNLAGQEVMQSIQRGQSSGAHRFEWRGAGADGRPLAAGLYFCIFQTAAGSSPLRTKIMLLK